MTPDTWKSIKTHVGLIEFLECFKINLVLPGITYRRINLISEDSDLTRAACSKVGFQPVSDAQKTLKLGNNKKTEKTTFSYHSA